MAWEPWTGCYSASDGCKYCYYYGLHSKRCGQNTIIKTDDFYKPLETIYMPRKKITKYKIEGGKIIYTCFTTDFFLPEADEWRKEAWSIIKQRSDATFLFLTKRIERFNISLPDDWGDGYDNVRIGCTVENQEMANFRLPLYLSFPIKNRFIVCSPLISELDLSPYLYSVESVEVNGESGKDSRECNFDWILKLNKQCKDANVDFNFRSTGTLFRKDGVLKKINPYLQRKLAKELCINENIGNVEDSYDDINKDTKKYEDIENNNLICPLCNNKLILREAKKGENIGKKFYGCSNFPKCRYIKNIL